MSLEGLWQLVRFGLVGGLSTLLYMGTYAAVTTSGVSYVLAALVAFAVSASIGFLLHHFWTFRVESRPQRQGFARWLALQLSVLGINIGLLAVLVEALGLDRLVAQAVLLPMIPLATFVLSRRWVFAHGGLSNASPRTG